MTFRIEVPDALGDKDLIPFYKGWQWFEEPPSPVLLDIARGTHLAPWAATLFATYALWLKESRRREVQLQYNEQSYVGRFLHRLGFPQLLGFDEDRPVVADMRIFPLTRVQQSKEIAPVASGVVSMLEIGDPEVEDALKYSLVELLRNVVQHSHSGIGGVVSAVFYPKTGLVDVVVADFGQGIRSALRHAYPEIDSDQKAVRFAMLPHVSGTFQRGAYQNMRDNAGLGLFFIKEIASRAHGGFFLGSGRLLADVWGEEDGTQKKRYVEAATPGWRGTMALLQLRKDSIGEFGELLQRCREIAAEVRKSPKDIGIDFLDEKLELEGITTVDVSQFSEDVEAAAQTRDGTILPTLSDGKLIVIDFHGVRAATQSFIHALMYKVFRDGQNLGSCLTVARTDSATEQAIRAVAAYAVADLGPA